MAASLNQKRKLGKTEILVSTVAMGCWSIVGDKTWGHQDEMDSVNALKTAFDCGINFFDTAELYGDGYSETLIGRALSDKRDQVVIASKISSNNVRTWTDMEKSCEESLRRLRTDRIDVYHLHWPARDVPIAETISNFERLQKVGKIRAFAVSNFGSGDLNELLQYGRCEANQLPYSLLWRVIEKEIQSICVENKISITCYSPLAQGMLTGKFRTADEVPEGRARTRHFSSKRPQTRHGEAGCEAETFEAVHILENIAAELGRPLAEISLAWLLHQPGVTSVIAGARNPAQVRANAAAMQLSLSDEIVSRLNQATEDLRKNFGTNPDMWEGESGSRYR